MCPPPCSAVPPTSWRRSAGGVASRERVAGLVVRLLPRDQSLSEATVDAVLAEVMDDVAALRRFLVEEGRLTRRGAEDYRRVDA